MAIYLARWANMGFLPRFGGVMDQDPAELQVMDIALSVFEERRKRDEEQASRKR